MINDLSPILVSLGPVQIRWYGLMFATGIALGYLVILWAFKREKYNVRHLESLAVYLFFGLIIGARLGHIFFYNPGYFLANPVEILKVWHGGLASHGATIGLFVAFYAWVKVHKVKFLKYPDVVTLGIPVVAAFVRIGNFFNSEIVGTSTEKPWGVVFKRLGEDFPRHPAQLYEAILNLVIFVILIAIYKKAYKKTKPLFFMFLYILLYFGGRFVLEFWKDLQGPFENFPLAMGQMLSLIGVLAATIYFIFIFPRLRKR